MNDVSAQGTPQKIAQHAPYESAEEKAQHAEAIDELAIYFKRSADDVRVLYERELLRLKEGARINDFLMLFARRRTREALGRQKTIH